MANQSTQRYIDGEKDWITAMLASAPIVEGKSPEQVEKLLIQEVKEPDIDIDPDVVKEITIKRVTKAEMRKIYRAMGQGKEDEPEPTEEGFLDRFSKKGKEKRAKEKGEKQAKDEKSEKEKAEIKRMDNLGMKGSGQHTLSPDEKSELSRLRSKYSDLVKRREEKHRGSGHR